VDLAACASRRARGRSLQTPIVPGISVFFAYVFYEIAEFILLFTLHTLAIVTREQYKYAYCATLLFSIVLRFG